MLPRSVCVNTSQPLHNLQWTLKVAPWPNWKYPVISTFVDRQPPLKLPAQHVERTHICGLLLSQPPTPSTAH